jgi:hypothetical protein
MKPGFCCLCGTSRPLAGLISSGQLLKTVAFLTKHPDALGAIMLLSCASSCGEPGWRSSILYTSQLPAVSVQYAAFGMHSEAWCALQGSPAYHCCRSCLAGCIRCRSPMPRLGGINLCIRLVTST